MRSVLDFLYLHRGLAWFQGARQHRNLGLPASLAQWKFVLSEGRTLVYVLQYLERGPKKVNFAALDILRVSHIFARPPAQIVDFTSLLLLRNDGCHWQAIYTEQPLVIMFLRHVIEVEATDVVALLSRSFVFGLGIPRGGGFRLFSCDAENGIVDVCEHLLVLVGKTVLLDVEVDEVADRVVGDAVLVAYLEKGQAVVEVVVEQLNALIVGVARAGSLIVLIQIFVHFLFKLNCL